MSRDLKNVCAIVLREITPSPKERSRINHLAETLRKKVEQETVKAGLDATVRVEGSVAKDTWLRKDPDIDIFIQLPPETPREFFQKEALEIAKKSTKGAKHVERFAEHPYLEAVLRDSTHVNIVPCYKSRPGEWKSATDRTPYHTDYVKKRLDQRLCGEVRLLKQFMKGVNVYGAEIKIGGFSGYLCELLILHCGSFAEVLKAFADWRDEMVIDYENYYVDRPREVELLFREPLKVIDPVDPARNVASAVRRHCLDVFIAASREFLTKPRRIFFYPPKTELHGKTRIKELLASRGTALVLVKFGEVNAVPDVLWGQLYRTQRSIRRLLEQNDFNVLRDTAWSDESSFNILVFEIEKQLLPFTRKHVGPPLEKPAECKKFLRVHLRSPNTIYGPLIDSGRWVVWTKRRYTDAAHLLNDKLKDGGRSIGVSDAISKTLGKGFKVLVNEEILKLYSPNSAFARLLTEYLKGKPFWLE